MPHNTAHTAPRCVLLTMDDTLMMREGAAATRAGVRALVCPHTMGNAQREGTHTQGSRGVGGGGCEGWGWGVGVGKGLTRTKCPRWFVPNCISKPSAVSVRFSRAMQPGRM
jgi:hypothetical protein